MIGFQEGGDLGHQIIIHFFQLLSGRTIGQSGNTAATALTPASTLATTAPTLTIRSTLATLTGVSSAASALCGKAFTDVLKLFDGSFNGGPQPLFLIGAERDG